MKFQQISIVILNIPNHLECFHGKHDLLICFANIPRYNKIPRSYYFAIIGISITQVRTT